MSGHSKWSTIKHKKAALDAKKGALFTKLARDIAVSAREGGSGDPNMNFRLRLMMDKARAGQHARGQRGPRRQEGPRRRRRWRRVRGDRLRRLRPRRNGHHGEGAHRQPQPHPASNVRAVFSRGGGNLGEAGSVAWIFESKAVITVEEVSEEQAEEIALAAIDAGAEDFKVEDGVLEITGVPNGLEPIAAAVKEGRRRARAGPP